MPKGSQLLIELGEGLSLMVGLPRIATWKTPSRPKKPRRGMVGFNSQTKSLEYFNGSDWFAASMGKV
jgi:hypothetical protein